MTETATPPAARKPRTRKTSAAAAPDEAQQAPEATPAAPEAPTAAEQQPRNVVEAIIAVMREVRWLGKDGFNDHHKFNFRGIDGTVNALGPAFRKYGLLLLPIGHSTTYETVPMSGGRTQQQVHVDAHYRFLHSDADANVTSYDVNIPGEALDQQDKGTAKAMSVALRTALLQTFMLPTDQPDPDSEIHERHAKLDPVQVKAALDAAIEANQEDPAAAVGALITVAEGFGAEALSLIHLPGKNGESIQGDLRFRQVIGYFQQQAAAQAEAAKAEQDAAEGPTADVNADTAGEQPAAEAAPEPPAETAPEEAALAADAGLTPEQEAARASASAEVDTAKAKPSAKERLTEAWLREVIVQAEILGRTPIEVVQPLVSAAEVESAQQLPVTRLSEYVVKVRARAIEVLRESGRAQEAERYGALPTDQPAHRDQILDAPGDADARTSEAAPA